MMHEMPSTLGRIAPEPEHGVALYDRTGKLVRRGPALLRMPSSQAAESTLARACDRTAKALAMLMSPGVLVSSVTLRKEITVAGTRCVVHATTGADESIMVRVERAPFGKDETTLRVRYALTQREFEVAVLVALGASNREIACELGISEKTSRKHTDAVFRKLGVNTRSKVAPFMLGIPGMGMPARVA